jgi:hypothetical protein
MKEEILLRGCWKEPVLVLGCCGGRRKHLRQHSKEGWSPATAEKLSQIHWRTSLLCSTPPKLGGFTLARDDSSSWDLAFQASM